MLNVLLLLLSAHNIFGYVTHCLSCFCYYLVFCCSCLAFIVVLLVPKVHNVVVAKHSLCSYFCLMFMIMLLP
jgi:hypothetical protein